MSKIKNVVLTTFINKILLSHENSLHAVAQKTLIAFVKLLIENALGSVHHFRKRGANLLLGI